MTDPYADLERELVDLGRALVVEEPPPGLVDAVMARVTASAPAAPPRVGWLGRRRWRVAVAALVSTIGLSFLPPVRAAVREVLRIGGVVIQPSPPHSSTPSGSGPTASPEAGGTSTGSGGRVLGSLEEASRAAGFPVRAPAAFGPPSRIEVVEEGRVVALSWAAAGGMPQRRLDVFDGTLDWGYLKTVWSDVQPVDVDGRQGVWIAAEHEIQWIDRSGTSRPATKRLAGPTLVWVGSDAGRELTYRLEGVADLTAALEAARSTG